MIGTEIFCAIVYFSLCGLRISYLSGSAEVLLYFSAVVSAERFCFFRSLSRNSLLSSCLNGFLSLRSNYLGGSAEIFVQLATVAVTDIPVSLTVMFIT